MSEFSADEQRGRGVERILRVARLPASDCKCDVIHGWENLSLSPLDGISKCAGGVANVLDFIAKCVPRAGDRTDRTGQDRTGEILVQHVSCSDTGHVVRNNPAN